MNFFKRIIRYISFLFISVLIALILRIFVISFFRIPTVSMVPSLYGGDFIMVNKLCYGTRLLKNFSFLKDGKKPTFIRLKGYSEIKRNDVIVFNAPFQNTINEIKIDLSEFLIKRCIALPGDTLSIIKGEYRINGKNVAGNKFMQQKLYKERIGLTTEQKVTFPFDSLLPWTILDFGPFVIPGKGMKIELNKVNLLLYRKILNYENTDKDMELGKYYTFKNDWFFMAGDNVINSCDSRYWGVVPKDCIVGKAVLVLFSKNIYDGQFQKSRFLKWIK